MNPRHPALSLVATTLVALACAKQGATPAPAPVAATASAAQAATPLPPPEVGSKAPDFKFTPVTLSGIGKSTKLSALKGQTTVVWFFPKARTRG